MTGFMTSGSSEALCRVRRFVEGSGKSPPSLKPRVGGTRGVVHDNYR